MWVRAYGPISAHINDALEFLDFQFNGWGGTGNYVQSNRLSAQLDEQCVFQAKLTYQNFVLEGGNIESDGAGTVLCNSQSTARRNPDYSRSEVESYLCKHLGAQRVIGIEHGHIAGDISEGGISHRVRFANADKLLFSACDDPQDEHYLPLQALRSELENLQTLDGKAYQLIPLALPQTILNDDGQTLPASYCDFVISNQHVFVPQFGDTNDAAAVTCISELFPEHKTLGIDCTALLQQFGSLRAASMNLFAEITY